MPDFKNESKFWDKGFSVVAGCDEVGRGCFAGPVVAGCVVFVNNFKGSTLKGVRIDDSKKLTFRQRVIADNWIRKNALSFGIGQASVSVINKLGIKNAADVAFRKAVANTNKVLKIKNIEINFLLTDAFLIPKLKGIGKSRQLPIIKGDQKSFSIAAASIIAKVYRDKIMIKDSGKPKLQIYKWNKNKGYGTKEHREAILEYGITTLHRTQFVATFLSKINR